MKKYLIIFPVILFSLAAAPAFAAISHDANTNGSTCLSCATFSYSFTMGSVTNGILFVNVKSPGDHITGVTYAGSALTLAVKIDSPGDSGGFDSLWYKLSPASGMNTIAITADGSLGFMASQASSYSGVAQNAPEATNSATTASISVTSVSSGDWLVGGWVNDTGTCTTGAGTTLRGDSGAYATCMGDSGGTVAPGSNALVMSGASIWGSTIAAIAPAGSGGGGSGLAPINDTSSTASIGATVYGEMVALPLFIFKNYETQLVWLAIAIALMTSMFAIGKVLNLL